MDGAAIFAAHQVFEKDAQGKREFCEVGDALLFQKLQPVNVERLSAHVQLVACAERIARVNSHPDSPFAVIPSLLCYPKFNPRPPHLYWYALNYCPHFHPSISTPPLLL